MSHRFCQVCRILYLGFKYLWTMSSKRSSEEDLVWLTATSPTYCVHCTVPHNRGDTVFDAPVRNLVHYCDKEEVSTLATGSSFLSGTPFGKPRPCLSSDLHRKTPAAAQYVLDRTDSNCTIAADHSPLYLTCSQGTDWCFDAHVKFVHLPIKSIKQTEDASSLVVLVQGLLTTGSGP